MDARVVLLDRMRYLLQDRRLASLRRRHDHAPLSFADGRDQIDDPRGRVERIVLQLEPHPLVGKQRSQVLETRSLTGLFRRHPANRVDPQQGGVLLARSRRAACTLDGVATP